METSEVLNKAADLIEERGWIQASGDGTEGDWWGEAEGSPVCLEGAIIAALGGEENEIDNATVGECPAYLTVKDYLAEADRAHGRYLFIWNDEEDRTAGEVIEVLRACAVIEASRERETAPEPVSS